MRCLYAKQKVFKLTDHYAVTDENQQPVYYIDQDFKLIGHTVRVSDANRVERFVCDRVVLSFLPRFNINFADGREIVLKSRLTMFRRVIDIEYAAMPLRLEGSVWDHDFEILSGSRRLGTIGKKLLAWADTYELTIYEPQYEEIVLALMIAVDSLKDSRS